MKNQLTDLNDRLFEQLERLNKDAMTPEELTKEMNRTDAMVKVSEQIISNATIVLRGAELVAEHSGRGAFEHMLPMLANKKGIEGPKKSKGRRFAIPPRSSPGSSDIARSRGERLMPCFAGRSGAPMCPWTTSSRSVPGRAGRLAGPAAFPRGTCRSTSARHDPSTPTARGRSSRRGACLQTSSISAMSASAKTAMWKSAWPKPTRIRATGGAMS